MAKALSYSPFLKLKANEVGALVALAGSVRDRVTPFFDLPRKKEDMSEVELRTLISKGARKLEKNLDKGYSYYVDNLDLADEWTIDGKVTYAFVIDAFRTTQFIPVVGLDRAPEHIAAVWDGKKGGAIQSDAVAIRVLGDDFSSYALVRSEFEALIYAATDAGFSTVDLVLDARLCRNHDAAALASLIADFIREARKKSVFRRVVVTGSSIPASIAEVAKVLQESVIERVELNVFRRIANAGVDELTLGDYTIVSPLYSEVTMPPEMLLNITAPKVLYSHGNVHHISRGGAIRAHHRGNLQYDDIAADLVKAPFFRGAAYSYGDSFLYARASGKGIKVVTPGSILKPTINAHITYMATDHPLVA